MTIRHKEDTEPWFRLLKEVSQDHVLQFWEGLNENQKRSLLEQIRSIDFGGLRKRYEMAVSGEPAVSGGRTLETAEIISLEDRKTRDPEAVRIGEQALRDGEVAVFLVAGGQGSRLGFDGPKGIYPVTPVKKKSLFQVFGEKIRVLSNRFNRPLPWYIMTSHSNHADTVAFFREHIFFGLDPDMVIFFNQEMIPAVDRDGKLILDAPDHIFMNPNGHGGSLKALWDSGSIRQMKKDGIKYISYFQVDNVLVPVADPAFLGYHIQNASEMSNKVVRKAYAEEKMGVVCKIDGRDGLVEYSDLSKEDMYAEDAQGRLKFWAGSIAVHIIDVDFVERENKAGFRLPYHIAEKSIPYIDRNGRTVVPDSKNGIKFETFIFDALLDTRHAISVEVERSKEFSPLKNAEGVDSPETVRRDLLKGYADWFCAAGFEIPLDEQGCPEYDIEISPTFAFTPEEFVQKKHNVPEPEPGLYLE